MHQVKIFGCLVLLALVGCHHEGAGYDAGIGVDAATGPADFASNGDFAEKPFDAGPGCIPTTCAALGVNCGPVADGCGGLLQCGSTCPAGQSCGGGGTSNVCGTLCVPATCAGLGLNCGINGDGCGNQIDCGTCTNGDTCGGGGKASVCGSMSICTPTTCAAQGFNCGTAGDGCGNTLNCGTCTGTNTCGGNGTPSQCGHPACVPKTCASYGAATCGPVADGCGGLIQCGGCSEPKTCGGSVAGQCSIPTSCTNLCLQQTACTTPGTTTTVSGTVYAPNGVDPLPNVLVFVPNAPVNGFAPGVACEQCTDTVSGAPLVSAATDTAGNFTLKDVPVGSNIPLVIQTGRWRRQVVIPSVASCTNTALPATLTRLPKNKSEGDIPLMAFVTGRVDALECVMRRIGIDDAEFTAANPPMGMTPGRVHLYTGDGSTTTFDRGLGGASLPGSGTEDDLMNTQAQVDNYDLVFFPCKGDEYKRPVAQQTNLINYANAGGRVFSTHFSYTWLYDDAPFSSTATWHVEQSPRPADQTGYINTTFPKGLALAQWLQNIGASTTLGQIAIQTLRVDFDAVIAPSQSWLSIKDPTYPNKPMHYTFNTPVGVSSDKQCGRVLFDDFHVETVSSDATYQATFPAECPVGAMTPQEKMLEFMIFDLGSCVTPDVPVCNKTTCAAQNIGCGPAGDGCGGSLNCGSCVAPQSCGGGGTPSQCGAPACTQTTCDAQGIKCGPAGDGCGGSLSCGTCPMGQTCGGGGMPGICGAGTCKPETCAQQGFNCGPAGDGCGNMLDCGTCVAPQTCGGSGQSGVCGQLCIPKSCADQGLDCGPAGDGCGGAIDCGTCSAPQTCGGGGKNNVCGGGIIP